MTDYQTDSITVGIPPMEEGEAPLCEYPHYQQRQQDHQWLRLAHSQPVVSTPHCPNDIQGNRQAVGTFSWPVIFTSGSFWR